MLHSDPKLRSRMIYTKKVILLKKLFSLLMLSVFIADISAPLSLS